MSIAFARSVIATMGGRVLLSLLDGDLAGKVFSLFGFGLVIRLLVVLSLFVTGIPS